MRPGKVVKLRDGTIGRTYDNEEPVQGKIIVHVFNFKTADLKDPKKVISDCNKKLLCLPENLTVIGLAD